MQAVMISIHPKWCELIAQGKKTVECRTEVPKNIQWDKPFKVYVYCTKARKVTWRHPLTGERMDGRVVGEFICDGIYHAKRMQDGVPTYYRKTIADACMTEQAVDKYSRGGSVYGWHISGFKLYGKTIALSDFGLSYAPQSYFYMEDRGEWME